MMISSRCVQIQTQEGNKSNTDALLRDAGRGNKSGIDKYTEISGSLPFAFLCHLSFVSFMVLSRVSLLRFYFMVRSQTLAIEFQAFGLDFFLSGFLFFTPLFLQQFGVFEFEISFIL